MGYVVIPLHFMTHNPPQSGLAPPSLLQNLLQNSAKFPGKGAKKPMPKPAAILFRVAEKEKKALQSEAGKLGFRSLGQHIASIVSQREQVVAPEKDRVEPRIGDNFSIRARVTAAEKTAFAAKSRAENLSESDYLRRHIRILLTQKADFCGAELVVLKDTNSQLRAIGRNLNQVVTRLQSAGGGSVHVNTVLLEALLAAVLSEKKALEVLRARSLHRAIE